MRRQPRLLAGLDILGPEIALVGDDVDFLDIEDGAGGFLMHTHIFCLAIFRILGFGPDR
jgi:hypothetical protein